MMNATLSIKTITAISLMSVVLILCGWITVPFVIPFTLQTFGVCLAVGLLGVRSGTLAVLVYLALGAVGLPVFSGMNGGVGVLAGPTGGYLFGFLLTALIGGLLMNRCTKLWQICLSLFVGLLADYAVGTLWYTLGYARGEGGLLGALTVCVLPYLLPDLLKLLAAGVFIQKVSPILTKMGWKRW